MTRGMEKNYAIALSCHMGLVHLKASCALWPATHAKFWDAHLNAATCRQDQLLIHNLPPSNPWSGCWAASTRWCRRLVWHCTHNGVGRSLPHPGASSNSSIQVLLGCFWKQGQIHIHQAAAAVPARSHDLPGAADMHTSTGILGSLLPDMTAVGNTSFTTSLCASNWIWVACSSAT